MKVFTLISAMTVATVSLFAQTNETKEQIKYSNITEFGFSTAGVFATSLELTTAHGVSVEKQHHFCRKITFIR